MKIGVVGLGLIGGSLALALRDRHEVTGYDIDEAARRAGASDGISVAHKGKWREFGGFIHGPGTWSLQQ